MTAVWDEVQEYLHNIGTLKDPELYRKALEAISEVFDEIHEWDHKNDQRVAKFVGRSYFFKDIRELNSKVKHSELRRQLEK